jgi:ribosome-binding factor A
MSKIRTQRFESELEKLFSVALASKAQDPRLDQVTVTHVRLSPDQQFAKVFFSYYQPDATVPQPTKQELEALLTKSSGFLKHEIAEAHLMRVIPQLSFHYDDTEEKAAKIESLLERIAREREARESGGDQ